MEPGFVPKISIITVSKNDLNALKKTMSSIPFHNPRIEWILIDALSTDGTHEYVDNIENERITVISELDTGIFNAMNKGLKIAKNDLVLFLNAGDLLIDFSVVEEIFHVFETSGCNWVVGGAITVDSSENHLWAWPSIKSSSLKLKLAINSYCHQSTVYRADFLRRVGGFVEDSLLSDWIMSLQLLKIENPRIIDRPWVYFLHGGVSSQTSLEYWERETARLRKLTNTTIFGNWLLDSLLQKLAAKILQTRRGRLIRPDLTDSK
jgi:glycosyltransferase involved in cell wall biosynthesis